MALASPLAPIDRQSGIAPLARWRLAWRARWWPSLAASRLGLALAAGLVGLWALFGLLPLGEALALGASSGALVGLGAFALQRYRWAARDRQGALIQAAQASRSKAEFLANTSHELRTPLNAVIGYAELLATGIPGPLTDKQAEYIGLIRQSGTHLLDLITDILDLAKVDAGRLELQPARVPVSDVIESCVFLMRERVAAGALRLDVAAAADLPALLVDAARLKQILLNLLSNAVKFTGPGGSIELAARAAADGGVVFSVSDTGRGMTAPEVAVALEAFGQVDGSLERRHGGAGLGLPLARRLTELHGGTLRVASAPGRGTTVTVALPPGCVAPTPKAA
ncbi:MAG TPA: HAMP domain-containing sensor histidine kinase [Candidatus Sulfotelmatobacter sp.]|nr:HAMP domain-containing sensor histidine kinase [Candidatus Sulfotelmatobacter sp.]